MTIQDVTLIWDENMPKKGNFKCHYKQNCQMLGIIMLHLLVGYHVYCICIVINFDLYTLPTSQGLYWIGVGGRGGSNRGYSPMTCHMGACGSF